MRFGGEIHRSTCRYKYQTRLVFSQPPVLMLPALLFSWIESIVVGGVSYLGRGNSKMQENTQE